MIRILVLAAGLVGCGGQIGDEGDLRCRYDELPTTDPLANQPGFGAEEARAHLEGTWDLTLEGGGGGSLTLAAIDADAPLRFFSSPDCGEEWRLEAALTLDHPMWGLTTPLVVHHRSEPGPEPITRVFHDVAEADWPDADPHADGSTLLTVNLWIDPEHVMEGELVWFENALDTTEAHWAGVPAQ